MGQDPEELKAEIEATREELGRDLDALAYKTNPSRIAHDRVSEVKSAAQQQVEAAKADPKRAAAAGGAALALGGLLFWLLRRRRG